MGIAVFAGMLGVTVFGLFLTPVFYATVGRGWSRAGRARRARRALPAAACRAAGARARGALSDAKATSCR